MTRPDIALIVAMAENGVIGKDGGLPWRIPADLKRFKALTLGKPCIMGRKTWESLPRKPLPGRANIVVTRDPKFQAEGAVVARSLPDAFALAAREAPTEIVVIGGAEIFAAALPVATHIYLTEIEGAPEGDVWMPEFARAHWRETKREGPLTKGALHYAFVDLERRETA